MKICALTTYLTEVEVPWIFHELAAAASSVLSGMSSLGSSLCQPKQENPGLNEARLESSSLTFPPSAVNIEAVSGEITIKCERTSPLHPL